MPDDQIRWARLEPRTRDKSLAPGLEARVHDPLWALARQWQFGELTADGDLGSAIVAEVTAHIAPLTRYRAGGPGAAAVMKPFDAGAMPLETLVEAEDAPAALTARARARMGQHFERLLAAHDVARYVADYRTAFPLRADAEPRDAAGRRFLGVLAGRVVDGASLYPVIAAALRPKQGAPRLPPTPVVDAGDADSVRVAAEDWLAWADALVSAPATENEAWIRDRMEYAFAVEAPGGDDVRTTLEAEEYTDGQLDWYTFTRGVARPASESDRVEVVGPIAIVPSAVTYPGMPASRLWEFEDARVDFGGVQADPEDLGRMLLAEFALVYGDDWLLVPLEAPAASLVRIVSLDVRDTFGRTVRVGPTTAFEAPSAGWRMFGVSSGGSSSFSAAPPDVLLVAPALARSVQGRAIEDVLLLRDETANMAWAVERNIEGDDGLPVDRAGASYERRPDPPKPSSSDTLAYRLRTDVREHWFPLLPQRLQPDDPSMTFRLGAMPLVGPDGTITPIRPLGRLLSRAAPGANVLIREEEVPREGARVTRAYQLARWIDGTTFLWLGRRKAIGRGEGSSGLQFDTAGEP